MRKIVIWEIPTVKDFKDVINPSQIIELEIYSISYYEEDLSIFTNLRKLLLRGSVDCKKLLPELRNLNYLTLYNENIE